MPVDFSTRDPVEAKAVRILQKQLDKAKAAARSLHEMARWQRPPRRTAKLGRINESIHQNRPKYQDDRISSLALELQCLIWSFLTEQPDRLMFALTCKWNAATYESLKDKPEQQTSKKVSPKSNTKTATTTRKSVTKSRSTAITPKERFAVMYRLQQTIDDPHGVIPKTHKLCYYCHRFISRSYVALGHEKGKDSNYTWSGKMLNLDVSKVMPKDVTVAMSEGYHCPDCVARDAFEMVRTRQEAKEWKKVVDDNLRIK